MKGKYTNNTIYTLIHNKVERKKQSEIFSYQFSVQDVYKLHYKQFYVE